MENPIKMDDFGVPLFSETSILMFGSSFPMHSLEDGFFLGSPSRHCVVKSGASRVNWNTSVKG